MKKPNFKNQLRRYFSDVIVIISIAQPEGGVEVAILWKLSADSHKKNNCGERCLLFLNKLQACSQR